VALHIFGLLWNVAFLKYSCLLIIACTCVIWYYNQGGNNKFFHFPVFLSFWWALRYHMGSLAFGSLILAIIWAIQLILSYVQARVQ
jgi:hypothetical protein